MMRNTNQNVQKNLAVLDLEKHLGTLSFLAIVLISGLYGTETNADSAASTSPVFALICFFVTIFFSVTCFISLFDVIDQPMIEWGLIRRATVIFSVAFSLFAFLLGIIFLMHYYLGNINFPFAF